MRRPGYAAVTAALAVLIAAAGGATGAVELGRNSVDSGDIKDHAVRRAHIAKNAVDGSKVGAERLTLRDLAGARKLSVVISDEAGGGPTLTAPLAQVGPLSVVGECEETGDDSYTTSVRLAAGPDTARYRTIGTDGDDDEGTLTGETDSVVLSTSSGGFDTIEMLDTAGRALEANVIAMSDDGTVDVPGGDCRFGAISFGAQR